MKITDNTSLVQLSIELAKFGIDYTSAAIKPGHERAFLVTLGRNGSVERRALECTGTGLSLAEAYDDALARFIHRMAQRDLKAQIH